MCIFQHNFFNITFHNVKMLKTLKIVLNYCLGGRVILPAFPVLAYSKAFLHLFTLYICLVKNPKKQPPHHLLPP